MTLQSVQAFAYRHLSTLLVVFASALFIPGSDFSLRSIDSVLLGWSVGVGGYLLMHLWRRVF